jgi:hypothetical protein
MRTYSMVVHTGPDSGSTGQLPTPAKAHEARAIAALVLGICSIVLIYPLGILLGPLALWFGITGLRRINRSRLALAGSGLAIAGIVTGGIVCGFYALIAFFEIVVFLLTGGPIPAY